jgi:hypothetical protein
MRLYQQRRRNKHGLTQKFVDERSKENTYVQLLKKNPEAYERYKLIKKIYGTP